MSSRNRWLQLIIPSFRHAIEQSEQARKQNKELETALYQLKSESQEFEKQAKEKERVVVKLEKKLREIQVERDEVYRQYNRLLEQLYDPERTAASMRDLDLNTPSMHGPTEVNQYQGWRLNIGCGRVKKPGYLNVDVDPSVKPDVILSLDSSLPFNPGTFDLIEAYHVIEHVYPWDTLDVFKEFLRVLKPGGQLAVECPNIEYACFWLVGNGHYGWESQMGMWAIYGDPNPKNPLHMHKWGFTPTTLCELLEKTGFVSIRRESPKTHVAVRDIRMMARKRNS